MNKLAFTTILVLSILSQLFAFNYPKLEDSFTCQENDYIALRAIYLSTDGDNWGSNSGWPDEAFFLANPTMPTGTDVDSWVGVSTDANDDLVSLKLATSMNLNGTLPPEIGLFCNIKSLYITSSLLVGSIPTEIGDLSTLETLWLYGTGITGPIPNEITNLSNLKNLQLNGNLNTGSIPANIGNMISLEELRISGNDGITGNIPTSIGDLINLKVLELMSNDLSGALPVEIGDLQNLELLDLNDNSLSGSIPTFYGNLNSLTHLDIGENDLSGTLPLELGNLTNLITLNLDRNSITGNIPAELGNLSSIQIIDLAYNVLLGSIPAELGDLSTLTRLSLTSNDLTGSIPTELSSLNSLTQLQLNNNLLTGNIPAEFGNLSALQWLVLSDNLLTGQIPPELGNLSNLQALVLRNNDLTGCFDFALHSLCTQLHPSYSTNFNINTGNNFISLWEDFCAFDTGQTLTCRESDSLSLVAHYAATDGANWSVPWDLNQTMNNWYGVILNGDGCVTHLMLADILIYGTISPELSKLSQLIRLDLDENFLSGPIPPQLGDLNNLTWLDLAQNQLSGLIPSELGGLYNLTELFLGSNQFSGHIPSNLGGLSNLKNLSLNDNQLDGVIPSELGNLNNLTYLLLNHNQLTGNIPAELGSLSNLTSLSLFSNNLSGCYDPNLANLCNQLIPVYNSNAFISDGNNFNSKWEDFCNMTEGICPNHCSDGMTSGDETDVDCGGSCVPCPISCPGVPDFEALIALYSSADGSSWINKSGWEDGAAGNDCDICTWYGVTCNSNDRVTAVALADNNLNGTIPSDLGNLDFIQTLNLTKNPNLTGSIPASLGQLTHLLNLYLSENNLTGNIPGELGMLSSLKILNLHKNDLSGPIPSLLGDLSMLSSLNLQDNELTGSIPQELGQLSDLTSLYVNKNSLSSTLPIELGNLSNLQYLYLNENDFTGAVPTNLFTGLTNLKIVNMQYNQFEGTLPVDVVPLSELTGIYFANNNFYGCIPDDYLSLCGNVTMTLYNNPCLSHNGSDDQFCSGLACYFINNTSCHCTNNVQDGDETDTDCGGSCAECVSCNDVPDLQALLDLYNNAGGTNWTDQTGWDTYAQSGDCDICDWFGVTCDPVTSRVMRLDLENNNLIGSLSPSLGTLTSLTNLSLHNNSISGDIPASITSLTSLTYLNLRSNELTGSIPTDIGSLTELTILSLGENELSGSIPISIGQLDNLNRLLVYTNQLTGQIPSTITELPSLWTLNINSNDLSGPIPSNIGDLQSLTDLSISSNNISGSIPESIATISGLTKLTLSNNMLEGTIPPALGALGLLKDLYLQHNQLSGEIPAAFDGLSSIINLFLYNNELAGCIPQELDIHCGKNVNLTNNLCLSHDGGDFNLFCNNPTCTLPSSGSCDFSSCQNGQQDGQETGIDCGGGCPPCPIDCSIVPDFNALMALYNSTDGPTWGGPGWNSGAAGLDCDICSWTGITCNSNDRVIEINLNNQGLNGTLPVELEDLTELKVLNLGLNQITGLIPVGLGNLSQLEYLNLSFNQLSSTIPQSLGSLINLQSLYLNDNQLVGSIPFSLFGLQNLANLDLSDNQMTGPVLSQISNLSGLINLELDNNQFSGPIPSSITTLTNLSILRLDNNKFIDEIPSSIGNLTNLSILELQNNFLDGCIPPSANIFCFSTLFNVSNNPCLSHNANVTSFCIGDPCVVPNPCSTSNCSNGQHDGLEDGIDCGGDCPPCTPCDYNVDESLYGNEIGERGLAVITLQGWHTITLQRIYSQPVIIAGPPSYPGFEKAVIQIRNVTGQSFEVSLPDWNCGGSSSAATLPYVVIEAGQYTLSNGERIAAMNAEIDDTGLTIEVPFGYSDCMVIPQLTSFNENDPAVVRMYPINTNPQQYALELIEGKANDGVHGKESLSVIIAERFVSSSGPLFEVYDIPEIVDHVPADYQLQNTYCNPVFVGKMATNNELIASELVNLGATNDMINLEVLEDTECADVIAIHADEAVHYMTFESEGLIYGATDYADLTIQSITPSSSSIQSGDIINIAVEIQNLGFAATDPFAVELFLSDDTNLDQLDEDDFTLTRFIHQGLPEAGSEMLDVDIYFPNHLDGNYYIFAVIDIDEVIDESNENNNVDYEQISITIHPCSNGIQDNGETGIDCGGACGNACPEDIVWPNQCINDWDSDYYDRAINTTLEVGTIQGSPSVSLMGTADYHIPIALPPGTNNLIPTISLSYSSASNNGLPGYGWGMSAFSMISRTNKNIYFDSHVRPVALDSDDEFTLDGARMLPFIALPFRESGNNKKSNAAAYEYGLEMEDFSRIYWQGNAGSGPSWWEMKTESGHTMEFGNTADSKVIASDGSVLFWGLSKTYDNYGNYVEYSYTNTNNELLIDEIRYTGNSNAGTAPFNTIKFHYDIRGDKNITYIVGEAIPLEHILKKIEVLAHGQLVSTYELCHGSGPDTDSHNPIRSYLLEVQKSGTDPSKKLNSTRFKYGEKGSASVIKTLSQLEKDDKADYTKIADFNADGLDDIALFRAEHEDDIAIAHTVEIYLKNDVYSDNFTYIGQRELDEYLVNAGKKGNIWTTIANFVISWGLDIVLGLIFQQWWLVLIINIIISTAASFAVTALLGSSVLFGNFAFTVADINGDNREEVILYTPDIDSETGDEQIFTIGVNDVNAIVLEDYSFNRPEEEVVKDFQIGDFDGDSRLDFLVTLKDEDNDDVVTKMMMGASSNDHVFEPISIAGLNDLTDSRLMCIDLDGDGKTDVLVSGGDYTNQSRMFTFVFSGGSIQIAELLGRDINELMPYPTTEHILYTGDFNGDGKNDLFSSNGVGNWEVAYFDGKDFQRVGFPFGPGEQPTLEWNKDSKTYLLKDGQILSVMDLNNDGKSDVFAVPHGSKKNSNKPINMYYSAGYSFEKETIPNNFKYHKKRKGFQFSYGDFNGDGTTDILSIAKDEFELMYLNEFSEELLLKGIKDGFNNEVTFDYLPMADPEVYTHDGSISGVDVSYPVNTSVSPIRMVKSMQTPNGNSTGQNEITYDYANAIFHRHGKGLLGMAYMTSYNKDDDNTSEQSTSLNSEFQILLPDFSSSKYSEVNNIFEVNGAEAHYRRYLLRNTETQVEDFVKETIVNTVSTYEPYYGHINRKDITVLGTNSGQVYSQTTTYSDYGNFGSTNRNRAQQIDISSTYKSETAYSKQTQFSYNQEGSLTQLIDFSNQPIPVTTDYSQINLFGLVESIAVSASDIVTRSGTMVYDANGQFLVSTADAQGNSTSVMTDPRWGAVNEITSITGNITTVTHDEYGRQINVLTESGFNVETVFDWNVQGGTGTNPASPSDAVYTVESIHPAAPNSKIWYSSLGKTRFQESEDFSISGNQTVGIGTSYDELGRTVKRTNTFRPVQSPLISEVSYDQFHREVSIVSPTGTTLINYPNGVNVSVTGEDGKTTTTESDEIGNVNKSVDSGGGEVVYNYFSHGGLKDVAVNGQVVNQVTYDVYARQQSLLEPNSGMSTYSYNSLGELISEDDARNDLGAVSFTYDNMGRTITQVKPEGTINYQYVTSGNGLTRIESINNYNGLTESFVYDQLDRISSHTQNILVNGQSNVFTCQYAYTQFDQLQSVTYPTGLQINYDYHIGTGFLNAVRKVDGSIIYQPLATNNYGQITQFMHGNGVTTDIMHNNVGTLKGMKTQTTGIFDYTYDFNDQNGLLNSRSNHVQGASESFSYDDHYRLTSSQVTGQNLTSYSYAPSGNLNTKSDVSPDPYKYDPTGIHAVTEITNVITTDVSPQSIIYNSAQQPTVISNASGMELKYTYGEDNERRYSSFIDPTDTHSDYERFYIGDFEKQELDGVEYNIHYIEGGAIVLQQDGGAFEYYYTYKDYLGSFSTITDNSGNVIENKSYKAWGQSRNSIDWSSGGSTSLPWLYRGYTGHEMLPEFNLINMNGRLYDPIVGRMLSVDNFAGLDGSSQSFNRYSYVINNPMMYTDPTGEIFGIAASKVACFSFAAAGRTAGQKLLSVAAAGVISNGVQISGFDPFKINSSSTTDPPCDDCVYSGGTLPTVTVTTNRVLFDQTPERYGYSGSLADYRKQYGYENVPFEEIQKVWMENHSKDFDDFVKAEDKAEAARIAIEKMRFFTAHFVAIEDVVKVMPASAGANVSGIGLRLRSFNFSSPILSVPKTVHGNSLSSLRPTWGYKLFSNNGNFLKNGITSMSKAEARYTRSFMSDKYMEKILFPNRRAAYNWEYQQNLILRGPLNKNMH